MASHCGERAAKCAVPTGGFIHSNNCALVALLRHGNLPDLSFYLDTFSELQNFTQPSTLLFASLLYTEVAMNISCRLKVHLVLIYITSCKTLNRPIMARTRLYGNYRSTYFGGDSILSLLLPPLPPVDENYPSSIPSHQT